MGVTLRYTALRLGIFFVVLVVVNALGAKGWLGLAIAAVVSVLLSLVLLRRQREQMAAALQQRVDGRVAAQREGTAKKSRFTRGLDEDNAAED
ncbi:DUF4229 domain-containing protein [Kineococcus aurantiacus]|uniref:Mannitol-specific phosphotransferase system IIBC component n=1 Tax=Kineococcus aurantiacus TaxID=37633 RepID=A0A7Y9DK92_9ACTN|nr:DUF4229 domain-containing protein [Kineococcus aurantiacus]NYD22110.1 mannitol-specific phosphotransferase system IIBC component [Kineococcus aurantiacus]